MVKVRKSSQIPGGDVRGHRDTTHERSNSNDNDGPGEPNLVKSSMDVPMIVRARDSSFTPSPGSSRTAATS